MANKTRMQGLGLVMIVKDEEAVIERALRSVIPYICSWIIVDTGSTDKTKEIIRATFDAAKIPGSLFDRPWVNFGVNRSEALELCRTDPHKMDWALMLDADDSFCISQTPNQSLFDSAIRSNITAFALHIRHGPITHIRTQIFRVSDPTISWMYEGVVHECAKEAHSDNPKIALLPKEIFMDTRCEGVRSRDPNKYLNDALQLTEELAVTPNRLRTLFYLAQSFRDANRPTEALTHYRDFLTECPPQNHAQERYVAHINLLFLERDPAELLRLVWGAINICPERLEAQFTYVKQCRQLGLPQYKTQQTFAIATFTTNRTPDFTNMFVSQAVYTWAMDDELAVIAFETGHYAIAVKAALQVAIHAPTAEMRAAALENARKAQAHQ